MSNSDTVAALGASTDIDGAAVLRTERIVAVVAKALSTTRRDEADAKDVCTALIAICGDIVNCCAEDDRHRAAFTAYLIEVLIRASRDGGLERGDDHE